MFQLIGRFFYKVKTIIYFFQFLDHYTVYVLMAFSGEEILLNPDLYLLHINFWQEMSRLITKPTEWLCAQRRLRSAWSSAQSDQSLRCALSGLLWAQAFFMRTVKTRIRLGGCPGWSESSLGTHAILFVLSWGGSNRFYLLNCRQIAYSQGNYRQDKNSTKHDLQIKQDEDKTCNTYK